MSKKIRFGIVGCGRIGVRHAEHILKNKRAELSVVCDINEKRVDELAKEYNSKSLYSFDKLLEEDVDVVSICTPSGMHAEMVIRAFEAGKHVLCEKPMALNLIDADKIIEAEHHSKKKFFLVKQNRYNEPIKALKDCVYNKKLGKISIISSTVWWNRNREYYEKDPWKGTMELDGGALITQCSHFLDLMIWLGGRVKSVYARMDNLCHKYIETEDTGIITILFDSGCIGSLGYTTSIYKKNLEGSISVAGERGTIKVGGQYLNKMEFWDVQNVEKPEIKSSRPLLPASDGSYKGSMSKHDEVIENVVGVLLDGKKIKTNSLQGRESIEAMQAAYISALNQRCVELPLGGEEYNFKLNEESPFSGQKKGGPSVK